jgi:hypothetical protein
LDQSRKFSSLDSRCQHLKVLVEYLKRFFILHFEVSLTQKSLKAPTLVLRVAGPEGSQTECLLSSATGQSRGFSCTTHRLISDDGDPNGGRELRKQTPICRFVPNTYQDQGLRADTPCECDLSPISQERRTVSKQQLLVGDRRISCEPAIGSDLAAYDLAELKNYSVELRSEILRRSALS